MEFTSQTSPGFAWIMLTAVLEFGDVKERDLVIVLFTKWILVQSIGTSIVHFVIIAPKLVQRIVTMYRVQG